MAETKVEPVETEELEMSDEEQREQRLMGAELRKLREARNMTQAELAAKMGAPYTEELVRQYESGEAPMDVTPVLEALKALGVSGDVINPRRILSDMILRSGYGSLTEERREIVNLLTRTLAGDQTQDAVRDDSGI